MRLSDSALRRLRVVDRAAVAAIRDEDLGRVCGREHRAACRSARAGSRTSLS